MLGAGSEMSGDPISYNEAKELAAHQDAEVRAALARREDIPKEILYFLAEDAAPEVRRTIALNNVAPGQTAILLAQDSHAGVRSDLAGRIAKISGSSQSEDGMGKKPDDIALRMLAKDQVPDVREVLADSIKDVDDAPADVIKKLATDSKLEVCGPVLEHSTVLREDDLIEIIGSSYAEGALSYISRRKHVEERVCDAIVETDDVGAIADLLSNHGAQLLEQTLDGLIDRAEGIELWHAPIVGRPKLPQNGVERLSRFVSEDLVRELERTTDVGDDEHDDVVKDALHQQLGGGGASKPVLEDAPPGTQDFLKTSLPLKRVSALYDKGHLTFDIISRALESQDYGFVLAALVVRSDVDTVIVQKIFSEKSAKGIVALCAKTKFEPDMMVKIQQRMGRIAPSEVIMPDGNNEMMSDEDADWQIEFYTKLAGQSS